MFNIIGFGAQPDRVFNIESVPYDEDNMVVAVRAITSWRPDLGVANVSSIHPFLI